MNLLCIVIIPGMGCMPVAHVNWYSWFASSMRTNQVSQNASFEIFPIHTNVRRVYGLLSSSMRLDLTKVVGHSSGAACAMRLLESDQVRKVKGTILVAVAHTDLDEESERRSEYFN